MLTCRVFALFVTAMPASRLDLQDIRNQGREIEQALHDTSHQAAERRMHIPEIIPGNGSGQLKKKVIGFPGKKRVKEKYHRIDKERKRLEFRPWIYTWATVNRRAHHRGLCFFREWTYSATCAIC